MSQDVLRPADQADIPGLARLWAEAFPGERTAEERAAELREGRLTWGGLEDSWVADGRDGPAAALRTYRMRMHLGGRVWPTMGLAGVAVAPDARRRGLGRAVCEAALRIAAGRGDVLSALFPFRVSFYASLGYALVGELHQYRFAARDLRPRRPAPPVEGVERVEPDQPARLAAVYDRVAARSNGLLERPGAAWRFLERPYTSAWVWGDDGEDRGYVVLRPARTGPDARLRVQEMLWTDAEAREALWAWLAEQRDQWPEIVYDALPGERLARRLAHPRRRGSGRSRGLWFESARLLRGPMLRLVGPAAVQAVCVEGHAPRVHDPVLAPDPDADVDVATATERFVAGRLPGQRPPPEGWSPAGGLWDFRLLDEF